VHLDIDYFFYKHVEHSLPNHTQEAGEFYQPTIDPPNFESFDYAQPQPLL
jgi:hypothetical protein